MISASDRENAVKLINEALPPERHAAKLMNGWASRSELTIAGKDERQQITLMRMDDRQ